MAEEELSGGELVMLGELGHPGCLECSKNARGKRVGVTIFQQEERLTFGFRERWALRLLVNPNKTTLLIKWVV